MLLIMNVLGLWSACARRLLQNHCPSRDQLCAHQEHTILPSREMWSGPKSLSSYSSFHGSISIKDGKRKTVPKRAEAYRMFLFSVLWLEHECGKKGFGCHSRSWPECHELTGEGRAPYPQSYCHLPRACFDGMQLFVMSLPHRISLNTVECSDRSYPCLLGSCLIQIAVIKCISFMPETNND